MLRVLEQVGQQVVALDVPPAAQWATVTALLNYILGVGGKNAGNSKAEQMLGTNRDEVLASLATAWSVLDANEYPFVRSVVTQMRVHDNPTDFIAGIDLILAGVKPPR